jgi:hypothetical protein
MRGSGPGATAALRDERVCCDGRQSRSDALAGIIGARRAWTAAADHGRPRVGPLRTQKSGPTGSSSRRSSHGRSCSQAHSSMPTSRRRPAFAASDQQRAAPAVQVGLAKRQRLVDAQPRPPQHDDQRAQAPPGAATARRTHDGDDFLDGRRVRRGCCVAGDRRGTPAWSPATDVDQHDRTIALLALVHCDMTVGVGQRGEAPVRRGADDSDGGVSPTHRGRARSARRSRASRTSWSRSGPARRLR